MPVMTAAEMAAKLDDMSQNGGAGPLVATRVLIRAITGCGDPLASEALTITVYERCLNVDIACFGTSTATGEHALLSARTEREIALRPSDDHAYLINRLVKRYVALGWLQVPA